MMSQITKKDISKATKSSPQNGPLNTKTQLFTKLSFYYNYLFLLMVPKGRLELPPGIPD
jgi:hypothetical protein